MRTTCAIAAFAVACAWSPVLAAEPAPGPQPTRAPRVFHAPTAWLTPHAGVIASAGADHRGAPFAAAVAGLGGVAELGLEVGPSVADCRHCASEGEGPESVIAAHALFRVGVDEGRWFAAQPAVMLGFRGPLAKPSLERDGLTEIRSAHLYLALSKAVSGARVHAGVGVWDVAGQDGGQIRRLDREDMAKRVRPFAGLSWTPGIYPRTSLMADVSWQPVVRDTAAALGWVSSWGIRYEALSWGSIELGVRHRKGEDLADSTVMVRVNVRRR